MSSRPRGGVPLALSFLAFVALGLPDGVLGVAWPSIRREYALPLDALGALLVAATVGYVSSSFSSGWLLARRPVGWLLAASCAITAASLAGYALATAWAAMVACGLVAGLGAGAIDAGLNTWAADRHGARTLNLLHACYGLGTTAGPILMTGVLLDGGSWRRGYVVLALAQAALAIAFVATSRRWPSQSASTPVSPSAGSSASLGGLAAAPLRATLRLRAARLGIVSFFLYVGVEATAGAWIYSLLDEGRGFTMAAAGTAVSVFWGGLLVGRLLFGLAPEPFHVASLPAGAAVTAFLAALLLAMVTSVAAITAAAGLLGAACGPIFPSLIASTRHRLGRAHAANAVGFQVAAAAVGQSLLPAAMGIAALHLGLDVVPLGLAVLSLALGLVLRALRGATDAVALTSP